MGVENGGTDCGSRGERVGVSNGEKVGQKVGTKFFFLTQNTFSIRQRKIVVYHYSPVLSNFLSLSMDFLFKKLDFDFN